MSPCSILIRVCWSNFTFLYDFGKREVPTTFARFSETDGNKKERCIKEIRIDSFKGNKGQMVLIQGTN